MAFNITESMSEIRGKITDTDLLKEVGSILADVERNFINLQDAKKSVDTESKTRKLEIREDLKPKIEEQDNDIKKLKTSFFHRLSQW